MVASIEISKLKPERVRQLLSEWFAKMQPKTIAFNEETNPKKDSDDSYEVAYEAVFEPQALDQARVEIWVTSNGAVAIGFENRKRIAQRLGVRGEQVRFAAGHEPSFVSESYLLAILDLIADGQIAISATVVPVVGLINTKAVVLQDVLQEIVAKKGISPVDWLKGVNKIEFSNNGRFLKYRSWQ